MPPDKHTVRRAGSSKTCIDNQPLVVKGVGGNYGKRERERGGGEWRVWPQLRQSPDKAFSIVDACVVSRTLEPR